MAEYDFKILHMPAREWRGWVRNRMTHELEWCIITAGLMGIFHDPEADSARIVLKLADFTVKPLCEGDKRGSHAFTYVDDCYSVKFVSKAHSRMIYTFGTETEEDFKFWYHALTGHEVDITELLNGVRSTSAKNVEETHPNAQRTDSGLGDDIGSCGSEKNAGWTQDIRGSRTNTYKSEFESIDEVDVISELKTSTLVDANVTTPDERTRKISNEILSDSEQTHDTTPESELTDEVPFLRPNAQLLRVPRAGRTRFSAPVGDILFWEEGSREGEMLTKTYSLPIRSPGHKRTSSEGDSVDVFQFGVAQDGSATQDAIPISSATPRHQRTTPRSSYSDPVRKPLSSRMTVKASRFVGRMTQLRSQRNKTPLARSSIVSITIEGDLLRKHKCTLLPCYCVLSGVMLYSYKSKQSEAVSELTIDVTKYKLSKLTAAKSESKELDCAFVLTSPVGNKEFVFIAKDLDLARQWYRHLTEIIRDTKEREQITISSTPDLRGLQSTVNGSSKFAKAKMKGSTFQRLAKAEDEKRNSIAARMSRASFEEAYGYAEETIKQRIPKEGLGQGGTSGDKATDYCDEETFIEITMDDVLPSNRGMGDRAVSRSMDDIGTTSNSDKPPLVGRSSLNSLLAVKTTPKTKRHKRAMPIPATEISNTLKTGYLEVKKIGPWKRCWAILSEDRLYLYRKPNDSHTVDTIDLDGYETQTTALTVNSGKSGRKFPFDLCHPRIANTHFLCDSLQERGEWMAAINERSEHPPAGTMDKTGEKLSPGLRPDTEQVDPNSQLSDDNRASASSSDISDGSPFMERRKQIIEDKYERVKEAQSMEMLRLNTILNKRRMSADVKINAVEKKLLQQRKQRKRKKNVGGQRDDEEEVLKEQLNQLKQQLSDIEKESQETTLKQEERLKAIGNKKDVEFKILEQERKLQKHRKAAQQALQQIVKGISSITPPVGGSRPRFDLICEEVADEDSDERKLSVASSVGVSSSDSMGSLCDPRKISPQEPSGASEGARVSSGSPVQKVSSVPFTDASTSAFASHSRAHRPNKPNRSTTDTSSDSSSSMDSPDLMRHNLNLVEEFTQYLPVTEADGQKIDLASRGKSKSFDSGISDEVDVNSNKFLSNTNSGDNDLSSPDANHNSRHQEEAGYPRKHMRTEVSEGVLRDIEEFEMIARCALEQASWVV